MAMAIRILSLLLFLQVVFFPWLFLWSLHSFLNTWRGQFDYYFIVVWVIIRLLSFPALKHCRRTDWSRILASQRNILLGLGPFNFLPLHREALRSKSREAVLDPLLGQPLPQTVLLPQQPLRHLGLLNEGTDLIVPLHCWLRGLLKHPLAVFEEVCVDPFRRHELTLEQSFRKEVIVHCVCNNLGHVVGLELDEGVAFAPSCLPVATKFIQQC